jgi:hypothetical protein
VAIAGLADKQDVIEAGVTGRLGWALAGLWQDKTTDQGAGRSKPDQGILDRLAARQRFGALLITVNSTRRLDAGGQSLDRQTSGPGDNARAIEQLLAQFANQAQP